MPNLDEEIRAKAARVLGVDVVKVKQTDDKNIGLALCGGGTGVWLDLTTWREVAPVLVFGEEVKVKRPKGVKTEAIKKSPKVVKAKAVKSGKK